MTSPKILGARALVVERAPYLAAGLWRLELHEIPAGEWPGDAPGLIATDRYGRVVISTALVASATVGGLAYALVHEVGHLLRDHFLRCGTRDPRAWNRAADAAMEADIAAMSGSKPPYEPVTPASLGRPDGLTAEEYYDAIEKAAREEPPSSRAAKKPAPGKDGEDADGEGEGSTPSSSADKATSTSRPPVAGAEAAGQDGEEGSSGGGPGDPTESADADAGDAQDGAGEGEGSTPSPSDASGGEGEGEGGGSGQGAAQDDGAGSTSAPSSKSSGRGRAAGKGAGASGKGSAGGEDTAGGKDAAAGGATNSRGRPLPGRGGAARACGSCAGNEHPAERLLPPLPAEEAERRDAGVAVARVAVAGAVRVHQKTHGIGSVPGGLARWAEVTLAPPPESWQTILARAVRGELARAGASDYTMARPSRRAPAGVILPGLRAYRPDVVVVVDTSGSIRDADLGVAVAEVGAIVKAAGAAVTVIGWDAAETGRAEGVVSKAQAAKALAGGGGTDMGAAVVAAARPSSRTGRRPAFVVCLTDGLTPWGESPRGAAVVVVVPKGAPATPAWARRVERSAP